MSLSTAPVQYHPVDLEPSLVGGRTYATRRLTTRVDLSAVLCIMLCLLYMMPGRLIVPNLTYAGRPALLIALGLFCWWVLARLNPWLHVVGPQPLRWAVLFYFLVFWLSYLAGLFRGLLTLEANAQDFGALEVLELMGVVLVVADGIPNWDRFNGVLRVFLWGAGVCALAGIYESITKTDVAHFFNIPGLQLKGGDVGFENRGVGFRVAGTTTHYIEFSAVMAIAVPYAIHFARFSPRKVHRRAATAVALLCAAAVPVAISRTGVLALAAVVLVMLFAWQLRTIYNLLAFGAAVVGGLFVLKPGLLGSVQGLFANADTDPSISGRTQDYALAFHLFAQRPWLGRGPWTLVPELWQGWVLDNQWLYTLITQGVLGVAVMLGLHITCMSLAWIARKRATSDEDKHLCMALISTQVVCILVEGTVDSLYYTTLSVTMALLMGACGTVWRFTHPARTVRTSSVRKFVH